MATLSVGQVKKLIEIFEKEPDWRVQRLFASGLLTDLRDAVEDHLLNPGVRDEIRRVLGLKPLNPPTDPLAEFFKTRAGLYVGVEFTNWILVPALAMDEVASETIGSPFDLPGVMVDAEIIKKLGEGNIFKGARTFCFYLKGALERQWDGATGDLLNNGRANIFYVRGLERVVFAVLLRWLADVRKWRVDAYHLNAFQWHPGYRAFPCNS